jgi:hypothetical protein
VAENPAAFPAQFYSSGGTPLSPREGMSLRDWFAGQALADPAICTGTAPDYDLTRWFGDRCGIMRHEIAARQAGDYADAMLAARKTGGAS